MEKFNVVFRGYDKSQVHEFIDEVIKNYEALLNKSKMTEAENTKLKEKLIYYQKLEDTLNRALFTAEHASDQIKSIARRESESIINEARRNASRILNDALLKAEKAEEHAEQLKRNTNVLKRRIRQIIETQLEIIEDLDKVNFKDIDDKY